MTGREGIAGSWKKLVSRAFGFYEGDARSPLSSAEGEVSTIFWGFFGHVIFGRSLSTHSASSLLYSRSAMYGKISVILYSTGLNDIKKNFKWVLGKIGQRGFSEK